MFRNQVFLVNKEKYLANKPHYLMNESERSEEQATCKSDLR